MAAINRVAPEAGWERALAVDAGTVVQLRHTLTSRLRDAYPVGARDLEIAVTRGTPDGVAVAVEHVFGEDPECRRIILAVPDQDEGLAHLAEAAGLWAVVEVELPGGDDVVLWVAEPARSTAVDDLPQT